MVVFLTQVLHEDSSVAIKYKQYKPLDQLSFLEQTSVLFRQASFLPDLSIYLSRVEHIETNPFQSPHSGPYCLYGSVASFFHLTVHPRGPSGQPTSCLVESLGNQPLAPGVKAYPVLLLCM